ncbi:MAG: cobalamin biosynthesis protein CobQ [Oscillospiraceae bacterium]|nr:cobalamin biosynthesis protein CobQ [Oscillospiraceae bacterium]
MNFKKIVILTGYYGCGKTNTAVNIALDMRKKGTVSIVDMDIVNPYFRTADFRQLFIENNISAELPLYAASNLDIPILDYDMERIINTSDYTVIDAGGDDAGATALGRYKNIFDKYKTDTELLYVYSAYRGLSPKETVQLMKNIENACGMSCTALVNNSNMGTETNEEYLQKGADFSAEVQQLTGLPLLLDCISCPSERTGYPVKRFVKMPWE